VAHEKQVPPYVIFSDATLRQLARDRPTQFGRLTQIQGIGARKQAEFGEDLVRLIATCCRERQLTTDVVAVSRLASPSHARPRKVTMEHVRAYFDLFEQHVSLEDAAVQLDKSVDTVSRHLSDYLRAHRLTEIGAWVTLDEQQRTREAIGRLGAERLKPLFEALEGTVPYARLRIISTAWQIEHDDAPST
jgi:ATP-dependent DNA helicase RecQ